MNTHAKSSPEKEMEEYVQSCRSDFWRAVFEFEASYILQFFKRGARILSVGCGPATLEGLLMGKGLEITGIDVSAEALGHAPDNLRTVTGSVAAMPFEDGQFSGVLFVASLQFIDDYKTAVSEAARVLVPGGRALFLLLNPASAFFKLKTRDPHSYVNKLKHADLRTLESAIGDLFAIKTEYLLGIDAEYLFESSSPGEAALYAIHGIPRLEAAS